MYSEAVRVQQETVPWGRRRNDKWHGCGARCGAYRITCYLTCVSLCHSPCRFGRCLAFVVGCALVAMAVMFVGGWYAGKHHEHHHSKSSDDLYDNGKYLHWQEQ